MAAVLREQGRPRPFRDSRPLTIEAVDLDGPGDGEVLVKIAAVGLCHSDLSALTGARQRTVPAVLGHEAAGVVAEIGSGVEHVRPGDHVVLLFVSPCGRCRFCTNGRPNLCTTSWASRAEGTLAGGHRRLHVDGERLNHASGVSAFAEFAVVSGSSLVVIDPHVPLVHAALLGCAVITGVGAVLNTARVKAGSSVVVIGLGGVGLSALMGALIAGAAEVIAVDTNALKLQLARSLGASAVVSANSPDCESSIREVVGAGADYVFEMSGASTAMNLACRVVARGGCITTAALPEDSVQLGIPTSHLVANEIVIRGCYMGGSVPSRDVPSLVRLYQQGRLPLDRLVTKELRLEEVNDGFDRLAEGEAIRDVVVFRAA